jgi:hypothetical protein
MIQCLNSLKHRTTVSTFSTYHYRVMASQCVNRMYILSHEISTTFTLCWHISIAVSKLNLDRMPTTLNLDRLPATLNLDRMPTTLARLALAQAICKECARLRKSAAMKGVCYDINMSYMAYSWNFSNNFNRQIGTYLSLSSNGALLCRSCLQAIAATTMAGRFIGAGRDKSVCRLPQRPSPTEAAMQGSTFGQKR